MVQVHHDEGVANRIDPESCADAREGIGEALTGERIGQPLSRDSTLILGADVVPVTEGNTDGRDSASAQTTRRGLRHWHVRTLFAREPGDPTSDHRPVAGLVRIGKARSRSRSTNDLINPISETHRLKPKLSPAFPVPHATVRAAAADARVLLTGLRRGTSINSAAAVGRD